NLPLRNTDLCPPALPSTRPGFVGGSVPSGPTVLRAEFVGRSVPTVQLLPLLTWVLERLQLVRCAGAAAFTLLYRINVLFARGSFGLQTREFGSSGIRRRSRR